MAAKVAPIEEFQVDVEDVEYLRHGDQPLLARLYKPQGAGPFPLIVELHGGAWCRGDRNNDTLINEALAKSGVVVAALDFRMPPVAAYPASVADIHYALRWLKTRASELRTRPDWVGIMGVSSGGHQAMLLGMRPSDPRYSAISLPSGAAETDGTVRCAILCWPVIDPLGRFHYATKLKEGGKPYPDLVDQVLPSHHAYWGNEDTMAEGSPVIALERGEEVDLPPVLYLQGTKDIAHPRPDLDRFVAGYRKAGGRVELALYDGEEQGFVKNNWGSANSADAMGKIVEFVHREVT